MSPLAVVPSPLAAVVNEESGISRDVGEDSLVVVPLRDGPTVVFVTRSVNDFGVGVNVCTADFNDDDTGVVVFLASRLSSLLLQRLGRRQRMVT